jgi:hypothetical protein
LQVSRICSCGQPIDTVSYDSLEIGEQADGLLARSYQTEPARAGNEEKTRTRLVTFKSKGGRNDLGWSVMLISYL